MALTRTRLGMKGLAAVCGLTALVMMPAAPALAAPAAGGPGVDSLPLTEVMLFTSGVGYFQRTGSLNGAAAVPLVFRTGQVQDVLKSLILIDPAGKVEPVTYSSREPLEKALEAFGINLGSNPSMIDLLTQLRGVKVQITTRPPNPETIVGVVLSAERPTPLLSAEPPARPSGADGVVNLMTDDGIRSVPLAQVGSLQILDPEVNRQVKEALGLIGTEHDSQHRTITLHFGAGPERRVTAGYITEAPVWKTSYRLALDAKSYLQGWAVVDNSTDQDWNDIHLTLVSGHPISFMQDLYTPLYVPRPVVPPEIQGSPYPQLAEENLLERAVQAPSPAAAPMPMGGMGGGGGGFGAASGLDRNGALLENGGPLELARPESAAARAKAMQEAVQAQASAQKVGELFQYVIRTPVSIQRQQSAMIPIVSQDVIAEKLDVFNPSVLPDHPESAVELTNNTGLHLKAGPATILDGGSYAGDARMPELEPNETELVSYAVDSGIAAAQESTNNETRLTKISIRHGVLDLESRNRMINTYRFKSKLDQPRTVLLEQPVHEGWTLVQPAKADEKTRNYNRFRVAVPAHDTVPFKVTEETVVSQTLGLVDTDLNVLLQYRTNDVASPAVKQALADVMQRRQHLADLNAQLEAQKSRLQAISTEQDRIRQNMGQLDRNGDLYKRYVAELTTQEDEIGRIKGEVDRLQREVQAAQQDLARTVDNLNLE